MSTTAERRTNLNITDFVMNDPLARFIIVAKKWSPLRVGLVAYAWATLVSIAVAFIAGTFQPGRGYVSFIEDYLYFVSETTLIPAIWGYYAWVIRAPLRVFSELEKSSVHTLTYKEIGAARNLLHRRWLTLLSVCLAVATGVLSFVQYRLMPLPFWHATNPYLLGIRTTLVIVPTAFVAWSFAFRFLVNAKLFKITLKNLNIHPLHPDRAGGLRELGRYALMTTYIIALGGCIAALAEYYAWIHSAFATAYYYHAALILYLIVAPASFFAPLASAHTAMLHAKDDLILKISRQFNQDFSKAYGDIRGSGKELSDNISKIEQLQRLHTLTVAFPVWPFDLETIRRFLLTMSSPVITVAVAVIINVLTNMVAP